MKLCAEARYRKNRAGRESGILISGVSMNTNVEFQMVCDECGSLTIKIKNPESKSRGAVVYCGHCGAARGTMGALRDLADRPNPAKWTVNLPSASIRNG